MIDMACWPSLVIGPIVARTDREAVKKSQDLELTELCSNNLQQYRWNQDIVDESYSRVVLMYASNICYVYIVDNSVSLSQL